MRRFALKTWNCFGAAQNLVAFFRRRGAPDAHRFALEEVKGAIESVDVACLQEVFLSDAELFFEALGHGHKTRDHNRSTFWPLTFGGSGLAIASRFRIVQQDVRGFSRPHRGAERFARKGMLHARLAIEEGLELDVITTHMQSGYTAGAGDVRVRQLREMGAWVAQLGSRDRGFVICGDFNVDGLSGVRAGREYEAIRDALPEFEDLGSVEDAPTFDPRSTGNDLARRHEASSPHQRIDYVLYRAPRGERLRAVRTTLALDAPFHSPERGRTFASDHYALVTEFEY